MIYDIVSFWETRRLISPHQKCDAKQPCTTCVNRDGGAECTYELRQQPHPAGTFQTSFAYTSPGPPTGTPPGGLLLTFPSSRESASPIPLSLPPCERPSTLTVELSRELSPRIHNEVMEGPTSNVSVAQEIHGAMECIPPLTGSSFTILPSIHFQTIPRPLRVPLSFFPPEHIQVSSTARNDLDMTLCVFV